MSKKKRFPSQYLKARKDIPSQNLSLVPLSKYYSTIHQLPLNRFIDCLVDDNIHALIISGDPDKEDLQKAWAQIRVDYADKMGDAEYRLFLQMLRDINVIRVNIEMIHALVRILRNTYVKEFADRLNWLLITNYNFDINDLEEYDRLLNICYNKTGGLKMRLDLMLINFESIQKKNAGNNRQPTRDYFVSLLIALSDHAQFMIPDTITVFEFCERIIRAQSKNKMIQSHGRR